MSLISAVRDRYATKTTTDHRTTWSPITIQAKIIKKTSQQICAETGMPAELVPRCEELLKSGMTIAQAGEKLQSEYMAAQPVKPGVSPGTKNLLIYGGIGVVGLFVLYNLMKKR